MTFADARTRRLNGLLEAIAITQRGLHWRLASAVLGAVLMSPWLGLAPCAIWLAVVFAFELNFQFNTLPRVEDLHARAPERAERAHAFACALGGAIYACAPVYAWSTGGNVGMAFAICWLAGTMTHAFHYYSDRRLALVGATWAPLLVMLILPTLTMGMTLAGLVVTLVMLQLVAVMMFGARDFERVRAERDAHDRARRAAEAANAAKSQFLATMSHELRTPLNAIIGYSEILAEDLQSGDRADPQDAGRIQAAARHLLSLISDVLDMSKIEAGRIDLAPQTIAIAALVEDVAATVRAIADANSNALTIVCEPGIGDAHVDATKLRQCLLNLAGNACKFTSAGEVVISARRECMAGIERIVFTVSDTGVGIPPEHAARIFEPFTQIDGSHQRRFSGTGLGLAITRELARLMGGDVELAPSMGRGAVFRLWVPAAAALASPSEAPAIAQAA